MSSYVDQLKTQIGSGTAVSSYQPSSNNPTRIDSNSLLNNLGYKSSLSKKNPEYREESKAEILAFAGRMGFQDTWRGVKQLLGSDEEEMKKDQERLNRYLQNDEYGGSVMAAYTAGLFGDPVGWFLPGLKARNAYKAARAGLISGGIVGATGYVDEDNGMSRLNMTILGMAGGGVLSPAMYKFNKTIMPLMRRGYTSMGSAIDSGKINQDLGMIAKGFSYAGAKAGAPIYGQVKKAGSWVGGTKPYNKFGNYFIDNFGLPDAVKVAKKNRRLSENKWAGDFNDVLERFAKLTPTQDRALYRLMTGEKLTAKENSLLTADIRALGKEGRTVVNKLGNELVDLGLLEQKTFLANKNKYLHRSYEKYADPLKRSKKQIITDEENLGVIATEFLRRGRTETFTLGTGDTMAKLIAKKRLEGWKVLDTKGSKIRMNRDWTVKERKDMGEMVSATFALAKTGKVMSNDVAAFRFYDDIAKMGDDVAVRGTGTDFAKPIGVADDWKRVPLDFIKVGGNDTKVRKFGNLSGHWVSPEVYNDLKWAARFKKYSQDEYGGLMKLHHKMLQYWKRTKTSLNPVVHMNNVMSNFVLFDLVNAQYKHLGSAGKDFYKAFNPIKANRVQSEDFKLAKKLGVFDADIMKRELTNFEIDTWKKYMKIGEQNDAKLLEKVWEGSKKYAGKTHMDRLYSAEDSVFRLGLFKDRMTKNLANGMEKDLASKDAAQFARKYMLDYEIDAPGVQLMRETMMPFISYTYRAAPIIAETLLKRPWKIAKWGLILNGANSLATDDSEARTERKRLNELKMGFDVLALPGASTMIELPTSRLDDKSRYLDVSRWIHAGDVLTTKEQGLNIPFVPAPLQPSGGAIGGIAKAVTGFDTFTKRQQPGVGSGSTRDELAARIPGLGGGRDSILGKEFIPMWNQYWNIYEAYVSEGKSHPTKDDRSMGEALAQTIGIKIKSYDEKKMKTRVHFKYQNRIESLTNKIKKKVRDKAGNRVGGESYDKEIERLKAELKKIQQEAKQALKKAK